MSSEAPRSDRIRKLAQDRMKVRLKRKRPLLIWLLVLSVSLVLYARREGTIVIAGLAEAVRYEVASTSDGRLDGVHVVLNQAVTRGQTIASLDAAALRLELSEARGELSRLTAELAREALFLAVDTEDRQLDRSADIRRFVRDVENAHVAYLEALAGLAEDRIELQGLELELERSIRLHESGLTSAETYDDDRIACEALRESVAEQTVLVEALAKLHENAKDRRDVQPDVLEEQSLELATRLAPYEYAVDVQGIRIEKVNLAIAGLLLKAPDDGVVTEIVTRSGEVVTAGQAVVSIAKPCARQAVVYLPEDRILEVEPGDEVRVRRVADRGLCADGTVSTLGTGLYLVPERLAPVPGVENWGRAVYVDLPEDLVIQPGEALEISF